MNQNTLYVALTFDICSHFDHLQHSLSNVSRVISRPDSIHNPIPCTFFIRCDNQIREIYGRESFILNRYSEYWDDLASRGHEIGWHPHLYRNTPDGWIQETSDGLLEDNLTVAYRIFSDHFPVKSTRIGDGYCSNTCIRVLNDFGISVDSTALPGRKRDDKERIFDWEETPGYPYHPSVTDYRVPGREAYMILEAPMSVIPIKTSYDTIPLKRYVNLSFFHELIRDGLLELVSRQRIIVIITHPYEILEEIRTESAIVSYSSGECEKNLDFLLSSARNLGKTVQFIRMSELPEIWRKVNNSND